MQTNPLGLPKAPDRQFRGVSFCVLCKGRRHQLEQTLLVNLEAIKNFDAEIVIVDYASPDSLAGWIGAYFREYIAVGKLRFCELIENVPFSIPIGKNFAHRLASKEILVNLDTDNFVGDLWDGAQFLSDDEFLACDEFRKGTFGRIGLWKKDFERLNGYDESLEPAGWHDRDLKDRARRLGLRKRHWPCTIPAIQNDKAATMAFIGGGFPEWKAMEQRNASRSQKNIKRGIFYANSTGFTSASFRVNLKQQIVILPSKTLFQNPKDVKANTGLIKKSSK